jgi:ATP-dependent DNA ligase
VAFSAERGTASLEGSVSKRKDSPYRSGRSADWLKMKNPACAAVKREAEEELGEMKQVEIA